MATGTFKYPKELMEDINGIASDVVKDLSKTSIILSDKYDVRIPLEILDMIVNAISDKYDKILKLDPMEHMYSSDSVWEITFPDSDE